MPGRDYWYRFTSGGQQSAIGRTRTAPAPRTTPERFTLAVASCQHYEQSYFAAYRGVAADAPDLVVHVGDYIYENRGTRRMRTHDQPECYTLDDYRLRYALYKSDPNLKAAHAAAPWLLVADDHEVANDYAGEHSYQGDPREVFLARRAAAYQAWYEHQPFPRGFMPVAGQQRSYTSRSFGDLVTVLMLDGRQYRSPHACEPGPLVEPCPELYAAERTMLGDAQEQWLATALGASTARWTLFGQQTLFAHFDQSGDGPLAYWADAWNGYPAARARLLETLAQRKTSNPVILSGDIHAFSSTTSTRGPEDPESPIVATELVTTSISSVGPPQSSFDRWLAENPNVRLARSDRRGYLRVAIEPRAAARGPRRRRRRRRARTPACTCSHRSTSRAASPESRASTWPMLGVVCCNSFPMTLPFARLPGRLRLTAAALAGACLIAPYSPSQESTDVAPIIPFPTETRTLPNGLNIIVVPMPSDGLVAYWSIVRTGSRDEYEAGRSGFAHFFEHMMFRGTERFPSDVYSRIITTIGADANAYTTDDHTAYHLSMAAEDLEQVMELESDRFQRLSYAEAAFQTEAGAVYGEYRKTRTEPEFALYEELVGTAFERHPYGHTTLGYERDIAIMPTLYEYSRTFFSRYYRPDNTVLFIAGDVTPANVFALVEKHYGGWQRGYVPPQIPVEPEQTAERRIDVGYDGQTLPLLQFAYKLPVFDPGRPHARRRRPLRRPRVRRDQRGVSAARARRAGRRGSRRGRGVQPRSRLARDHGAHQGPEQDRPRARRHRLDDRAVPRDGAGRAAARRSAAAAALRLPHGAANAGLASPPASTPFIALSGDLHGARSSLRDLRSDHAGRRACRGRTLLAQ